MEDESQETDERGGAPEPTRDPGGLYSLQARVNGLTRLGLILILPVYVMVRAVVVATQSVLGFVLSDAMFLCWTLCLAYTLGGALGKAQARFKWLLRLGVAALAVMGAIGAARLFGSLDGFPGALIAAYCAAILLHPAAVEWGLRLNAGPAGSGAGLRADGEG